LNKKQERQVVKLKAWIAKNRALEYLFLAILLPIENIRKSDHAAKIFLEVYFLLNGKQKFDDGFRILEVERVAIRDLVLYQRQLAEAFSIKTGNVGLWCLFIVQDIPELTRFMQFGYDGSEVITSIHLCEGKQREWILRINEDVDEVAKLKKTKNTAKKENLRGAFCGNCRTKEPLEIVLKKCGNCTSVTYCSRE
jgi:hypothetical protein